MVASGPFAMPSMSESSPVPALLSSYTLQVRGLTRDALPMLRLIVLPGTGRPRVAASGPDPMAAMHANADRKPTFTAQGESYSDDENDNIIDLEVVPEQSGESAPTGLIRHRSIAAALKEKEGRGKKKSVKAEPGSGQADEVGGSSGVRMGDQPVVVKEEPASPEKQARQLPPTGGRGRDKGKGPATAGRTDDRLTDADMDMDVDINGNRIDQVVEAEKEVVEAKQAIDLDEILIEDYEEDITGDFVHLEGEVRDSGHEIVVRN